MTRNASGKAAGELQLRFVRAVDHHMRYFRRPDKIAHITVFDKKLLGTRNPYYLCGAEFGRPSLIVGGKYTDPRVCKDCLDRLWGLAQRIAAGRSHQFTELANGAHFSISAAEIRDALNAPSVRSDFEEGPEAAPAEPLPMFDIEEVTRPVFKRRGW
jgi:hypothetical protein